MTKLSENEKLDLILSRLERLTKMLDDVEERLHEGINEGKERQLTTEDIAREFYEASQGRREAPIG